MYKWLGSKIGVEGPTISRIAAGKANPSAPLLILLAQVLECSVDDFMKNGGENSMS